MKKTIINTMVACGILFINTHADTYQDDIKRFKSNRDIAGHIIKTYYVNSQKEMIKLFYKIKRETPNRRFKVVNKSEKGAGASMVNYGTIKAGNDNYEFIGLNMQKGK